MGSYAVAYTFSPTRKHSKTTGNYSHDVWRGWPLASRIKESSRTTRTLQLTRQMSYKSVLCIILLFIGIGDSKPQYGAKFSPEDIEDNQLKLLSDLDDFCDSHEQTCKAIQMIVAADLVQLLEKRQNYDYELENEIQNNAMYQRTRRHPEADMIRFRAYAQRARQKVRDQKLIKKFKVRIGRLG